MEEKKMQNLQERLEAAIARRTAAKQLSREWFNAKAEVETLAAELAKANLKVEVPDAVVDIDWEQYDDE